MYLKEKINDKIEALMQIELDQNVYNNTFKYVHWFVAGLIILAELVLVGFFTFAQSIYLDHPETNLVFKDYAVLVAVAMKCLYIILALIWFYLMVLVTFTFYPRYSDDERLKSKDFLISVRGLYTAKLSWVIIPLQCTAIVTGVVTLGKILAKVVA